jgi:hypothetical protein
MLLFPGLNIEIVNKVIVMKLVLQYNRVSDYGKIEQKIDLQLTC